MYARRQNSDECSRLAKNEGDLFRIEAVLARITAAALLVRLAGMRVNAIHRLPITSTELSQIDIHPPVPQ